MNEGSINSRDLARKTNVAKDKIEEGEKELSAFPFLDALLENRKSAKDLPEEVKLKTAAGIVKSGLSIQRIKETRIFTLTFKSTNPLLCKEVVNAVAQGYVKQQVEEKLYIPKELLQFFPPIIAHLISFKHPAKSSPTSNIESKKKNFGCGGSGYCDWFLLQG